MNHPPLVAKVSERCKAIPLHPTNVSGDFCCRSSTLKSRKALCPNSICPELVIHARDDLKSELHDFSSFSLNHLKIPKIWKRALAVATPSLSKTVKNPKSYRPTSLFFVFLTRFLSDMSMLSSNPSSILCSGRNRPVFDGENPS